MFRYDRGEGFY